MSRWPRLSLLQFAHSQLIGSLAEDDRSLIAKPGHSCVRRPVERSRVELVWPRMLSRTDGHLSG